MTTHTLTVFNLKGGTAKSTTVVNLAAVWGEKGDTVLVVDTDPQGTASKHLGVRDDGEAFRDVLADGAPVSDAITPIDFEGVALLPGGDWLADVEPATQGKPLRELCLSRALEDTHGDFDRILVDCPPSPGLLNTSALLAADSVLIPVEAQGAAVDGLVQALDMIDEVNEARPAPLGVIGAMVCKYDTRTSLSREVDGALREHFPDLVLDTIINRNVRVAEAYPNGQPVTVYAPTSRGADDYRAAADEIAARINR